MTTHTPFFLAQLSTGIKPGIAIRRMAGSIFSTAGLVRLLAGIVVVLILALFAGTTYAQDGYPRPKELYVNDYAGVLSDEDAVQIRALFTNLNNETGVEATVVTIKSLSDYNTGDETIEAFATNLFNTWGLGDSWRNDGVLILVAIEDRKVRIEVGSGYGHSQDQAMQTVINEYILPRFKQEQYSQGLVRGAQAVADRLTGAEVQASQAVSSPPKASPDSDFVLSLVCLGFGLLILILIFVSIRSRIQGGSSSHHSDSGWQYDGGGGYSGGSDFGGGSSDGGGAGGDW